MNAITVHTLPQPRIWRPSRWLTIAATFAVVLSMVGYGIWDANRNQAPETPLAPYNPGLAMQSPPASEGCFAQGQPLMLYANSFPVDATTLIISDSGQLILRCVGNPQTYLIDSAVLFVTPTNNPATIIVATQDADQSQNDLNVAYEEYLVNLETGDRLELVPGSQSARITQAEHGPWYVAQTKDVPGVLVVVDLRTLETHPILPDRTNDESAWAVATSNADGSLTAIVILDSFRISRDPNQVGASDMLVIGDSFDDGTWVPLDETDGLINSIAMSPNGMYVALEILGDTDGPAEPIVEQITIIETHTGEIAIKGAGQEPFRITSAGWTTDSARFVYTSGSMIGALAPEDPSSASSAVETSGTVTMLAFTSDPNIMLADVRTPSTEPIAGIYRLTLDTGTWELLGQSDGFMGFQTTRSTAPVIIVENGLDYSWQNAATGEVLSAYSYASLAEATPPAETGIAHVTMLIGSPAFMGIDTDHLEIVYWGNDFQVRVIAAPNEPMDAYRHSSEVAGNGRFIVLYNYPAQLWDGQTSPVPHEGAPKSVYILDTEAEEPIWIPIE
ncbi:MAG: hypothetical protein KC435_13770 [Thermomicrobiales bacterium]|nr:hypothetical protein [Thermomicrobiales bacterium]